MKKGILEKLGLMVDVPGTEAGKGMEPKVQDVQAIQIKTSGASTIVNSDFSGDIIKDAYASLPESENNIFIVEELLKNFSMLPEDQKNSTVQVTLKTMGISTEGFMAEAQTRSNAVVNVMSRFSEKVEAEKAEIDKKISDAEILIENLKQRKFTLQNGVESAKKKVESELERLKKIIYVLGGK